MDYILNGQANGNVASRLLASNFDVQILRPFIGSDGRSYFTANVEGKPKAVLSQNANATLLKDEWIQLDTVVMKAAQQRLKVVSDLRSRGLEMVIPNGMSKTVLQSQAQSDISDAEITMDGLEKPKGDRPLYDITNLPLPIIHKGFSFPLRQIMASRNGSMPLDTSMADLCGRKVAETVEKLTLGTLSTFTFGGGNIYGLTNYPNEISASVTAPTDSDWTPATLISEVLAMMQASVNAYHYGPWVLYYGPAWMQYMNNEYKTYSDVTLVNHIRTLDSISGVVMVDHLTGYDLILVQVSTDVIRMINGMDVTTVQWETDGGMNVHFKVMTIMVPQIRKDFNSRTGLVHATTS